ncbi:MAG: hypothetical protein QY323_05300 [Patescibacteria group bacterium]|nr:MAG: hypothetical protein QY323_05300 [Patescibacteria group bacterium]
MFVTPARSAEWLRRNLLRIRLESVNLRNRERPVIGLKLYFATIVPEVVPASLRFDMMIEVPEIVPETGRMRMGYRCPSFIVTDAMTHCSAKPCCSLTLQPAPRSALLDDCHLTTFLTLADEAAQYARRDGSLRDWRNQVKRIRFWHPEHRDRKHTAKNPDFEPMQTVHVSTIWDAVPRALQSEDHHTMEEFLCHAEQAFDEAFADCEAGTIIASA